MWSLEVIIALNKKVQREYDEREDRSEDERQRADWLLRTTKARRAAYARESW